MPNHRLHRRTFTANTLALLAAQGGLGRLQVQAAATLDHDNTILENQLAGSPIGPWRRLFLDTTTVEAQHGASRVFHAAEKHDDNPILIADRPWEGTSAIIGPYIYGTVFREDSLWRMWYQLLYQGNHIGYAESQDGVHWSKPELPIVRYLGTQKTNLVVSAFEPAQADGGLCHNPSVVKRPHEPDPARRYALYGFDSQAGHPRVAFSQDGLRWRYNSDPDRQPLFSSSDVVHFFYDPYRARYVSTWKTRNRRGRAVGIATSSDGEHWTKPVEGPVLGADDHDPDTTQVYGMPVFPYQGLYIGLPWIYQARYFRFGEYSIDKLYEAQSDSPRTIEPHMAWSWDLISWTRPFPRVPFIHRSGSETWDSGMIVTARAPVEHDGKLYFYYGGTNKVHDEKRVQAGIGLATLRSDGFCSMQSTLAHEEAWLLSRREPLTGPSVVINAKTHGEGYVVAEIVDRQNQVLGGFSRHDCLAFRGDSVAHLFQWKHATLPKVGKNVDYKIRFYFKDADLFSYLPADLDPGRPDLARAPSTGP